jgi:hypothetical protein
MPPDTKLRRQLGLRMGRLHCRDRPCRGKAFHRGEAEDAEDRRGSRAHRHVRRGKSDESGKSAAYFAATLFTRLNHTASQRRLALFIASPLLWCCPGIATPISTSVRSK